MNFLGQLGSTHVKGARATGRVHVVEVFFAADDSASWFISCYEDEYRKIDGRWCFQKRALTTRRNGKF